MSSADVSGEPGSACLLEYAEGAAFTRAFKRWTGSAPSQVRGA